MVKWEPAKFERHALLLTYSFGRSCNTNKSIRYDMLLVWKWKWTPTPVYYFSQEAGNGTHILFDMLWGIECNDILGALCCCLLDAVEDAREEVHEEERDEGQPSDLEYCRPEVDHPVILNSPGPRRAVRSEKVSVYAYTPCQLTESEKCWCTAEASGAYSMTLKALRILMILRMRKTLTILSTRASLFSLVWSTSFCCLPCVKQCCGAWR